jgi:hypothetical protein
MKRRDMTRPKTERKPKQRNSPDKTHHLNKIYAKNLIKEKTGTILLFNSKYFQPTNDRGLANQPLSCLFDQTKRKKCLKVRPSSGSIDWPSFSPISIPFKHFLNLGAIGLLSLLSPLALSPSLPQCPASCNPF